MKPLPWSAHTGSACSVNRWSPGGVPKKKTSWRVARTRSPMTSGNRRPSHGPQAKTNASAAIVVPSDSLMSRSSPPGRRAPGSAASWRDSPPSAREPPGTPAPAPRAGLRRELAVLAAFGQEAVEHRGAGAARREVAAILLEDGPSHPLAVDLRVAARGLRTRQFLERKAGVLEQRQRRLLVGVVALNQPEHADGVVQFAAPTPVVLFPQLERARRETGVDRAGAVGRADDAGLAAGAGARVAGPPGVDQRDAGAAPQQVECGPAAERPRPDHHHVPLLAHRNPALQVGRRTERRARGGARLEERPPPDAPHDGVRRGVRASRTAARTASRSAGGRLGPHRSSHASLGITPSAAR